MIAKVFKELVLKKEPNISNQSVQHTSATCLLGLWDSSSPVSRPLGSFWSLPFLAGHNWKHFGAW